MRIGITLGDPNGIGPELVLALPQARLAQDLELVVYGPKSAVESAASTLRQRVPGAVQFADYPGEAFAWQPGKATPEGGAAAFNALEQATDALLRQALHALVTLPINKKTIQQPGFDFPGHTEYLGHRARQLPGHAHANVLMLFVHEHFRLALVTGHLPLRAVPDALTVPVVLERLHALNTVLQADFGIAVPQIALLSLNPHAGDGGLLGTEDQIVLEPALRQAGAAGLAVHGPFAADGFFALRHHLRFDATLAIYHDQGLIPFKALTGGAGVNYTAGLPFVRTSPDHGTAYDIAGRGLADPASFFNALELAQHIAYQRQGQPHGVSS